MVRSLDPLSRHEMDDIGGKMRPFQSMNPDVSLVVPAYHEQDGIGHAMRAILPSIQAAKCKVECIVVANATDDDKTAEIAENCGAKVIIEPKKGLTYARQSGIENTTGSIIIQHDGDVRGVPDEHINAHMRHYNNSDNVGVAGFYKFDQVSIAHKLLYNVPRKMFHLAMATKCWIQSIESATIASGSNLSYRRTKVEEFGGYTSFHDSNNGEDYLMGRHLMERGTLVDDRSPENTILSDGRRFATAWKVSKELRKKVLLGLRRLGSSKTFLEGEQFEDIR